jgi:dienelactone hydrolase
VNHLIERGLVDEERLGIMGWSNGSILAIACCLEDKRFKALCAGAGDVNWISDYGTCAFGAGFDNAYFGGPPWEKIGVYIEKSPLFKMAEMETPTLIMFGTQDVNVPTEQGWQHFRALQQIGRTPVRFILFPGQPHGLRKLSYQTRKMNEELAWFEQHLFDTYEERNKAYDESSPLAMALEKEQVKRSEYLYGERTVDGVLAPETVEYQGLTVGRFEVTRAQFRQFDQAYHYPQQTGNYPANNVPFERAVAYCTWLSEQTGRHFRLPTEEEMNKLLKAANSNFPNENNLEYWAGYDATPDDAALLGDKITELEQSRLLIEEAGSFRPVGERGVYDLGGNVAEWVTGAEGEGKVTGLSAVTTRDGRSIYTAPPPRYTGFRVIEEKPADTKE